jgi:SAM-dependent methyltransferase
MKPRLMDLLACPLCGADFELRSAVVDAARSDEIVSGELKCTSCATTFPIVRGVPRLVPADLSIAEEKTAAAFGWQWQEFVEMHNLYEAQFLDWIHPIEPAFFQDKVVLDAGCGIGRHTYYAAQYGARDVVAMDLSAAVETAYLNTGAMSNVHVVQGDINRPPFRRSKDGGPFDFVYSIGVLHHMPDPEAGFRSLVTLLRPGGAICAWVYGRENNAIVHGFINPLRKTFTSRLPPSALTAVAWPLSVVLHATVKGIYGPSRRTRLFKFLPSHDYLASLAPFKFRQNYNIVFDHLVAPLAFYLKREEFEAWFHRCQLREIRISWRNENSWRGFGQVAEVPATSRRERDSGSAASRTQN